jgi:pimeloyl-ACP methyl ester carboxylesterase
MASLLRSVTSQKESDFLSVAYPGASDIHHATRLTMTRVTERWPGASERIDVVGISMGGLVARLAAACPNNGTPPLKIARLFTLATPHRGAILARYIAIDRAARQMRPGSAFLDDLEKACVSADYELFCYTQLRDWWVGATRAAPPGRFPFWIDTRSASQHVLSHFLINTNLAVLRDIARRLRGEEPVARQPTQPPCD